VPKKVQDYTVIVVAVAIVVIVTVVIAEQESPSIELTLKDYCIESNEHS
jgi:hypothetical protein